MYAIILGAEDFLVVLESVPFLLSSACVDLLLSFLLSELDIVVLLSPTFLSTFSSITVPLDESIIMLLSESIIAPPEPTELLPLLPLPDDELLPSSLPCVLPPLALLKELLLLLLLLLLLSSLLISLLSN